jgi:tripartite-type tricarboxylate transporter receptor subunit TctC
MTDLNARMLGERLEKVLKQPVVVLNKGGGATTVGGYAVASAKPDGYTLGFFPDVTIFPEAFSFFFDAPYSSKDLKPISNILAPVIAYMVKGDAPWNSMKELIEYAKKNPGVTVGIHGKMTPSFTAMAVLNRVEKTGFVEVPLESDAKIIPAVLGGHIQVGATGWPPSKSLYEAKKIKLLVLISPDKRVEFAAGIPTLAELGYKIASFPIYGIMGPKGMPDEVVKVIDEAVRKVSEDPQFRAKAHEMGSEVGYQTSASFERSLAKAKETYQLFLKQEGLSK